MRTRPASKAQAEDATTSDAVFYVITSTKVLRLVWASRGLDPGSSAAHVLCNAIADCTESLKLEPNNAGADLQQPATPATRKHILPSAPLMDKV